MRLVPGCTISFTFYLAWEWLPAVANYSDRWEHGFYFDWLCFRFKFRAWKGGKVV